MADLDGEHHGDLGSAQVLSEPAAAPDVRDHLPGLLPLQLPDPAGAAPAGRNHADEGFEPGDADWGVRLGDVRGQNEAKEEVNRVVSLWQSGEAFEAAGGKRERGLLFPGPPGTGKTMLAKAIATGFNCPFVSMPGSGFQQAFMGMDAVIVRYLAWKAKRLAAKWGGQCIVFIDEIDAVGMRRSALGGGGAVGGMSGTSAGRFEDHAFYGSHGALNPSQDLILETRAWRDRLFEARAPRQAPESRFPGRDREAVHARDDGRRHGSARAEPAARRDGRHRQPAVLQESDDELGEHIPGRVLRRPAQDRQGAVAPRAAAEAADLFHRRDERADQRPRSRTHQAGTHGPARVAADADKRDRLDIFDLYINKVDHVEELDSKSGVTRSRASRTATPRP